MKLLGLVLQNKKGQNLIVSSTSNLPTRTCIVYSHLIFQHIKYCYHQRLKIQRTINLQQNLLCAVNITKDYIVYIFVTKTELSLAFQAIRKVSDYFNRGPGGSVAKIEAIPKKIVQYMSVFQQFLYTRQLSLKQYIPTVPQPHSQKKPVDLQIFNKFSHIQSESDKKIIHQSQILSFRIESNEVKKKIKYIEDAQKFVIKPQDQIYLLDIDPEKEKFVNFYKKNVFKMAMGRRKRDGGSIMAGRKGGSMIMDRSVNQIDATMEFMEETMIEKEKIKLKIKQKLSLFLQNDKIKQVQQLGQIIIQGTQKQSGSLTLTPQSLWCNPKQLSKRISPNSLQITQTSESPPCYTFTAPQNYKSKPLIDYVLKTDTFNQDKIPLLFIYTMQVNSSNIQYTFKYKINQKWKYKIYQFDINVHLNKEFIVLDCKSIPAANSLKGNKVTWKCKEIVPGSSSAKGKILLAFSQAKFPPKEIISQIRLNMKCNCGLLQGLSAEVKQEFGVSNPIQKLLLIEYKILPS